MKIPGQPLAGGLAALPVIVGHGGSRAGQAKGGTYNGGRRQLTDFSKHFSFWNHLLLLLKSG
jgi:hypothetical protein